MVASVGHIAAELVALLVKRELVMVVVVGRSCFGLQLELELDHTVAVALLAPQF